jgi:PAS domain S-box-containing protein
MVLATIVDVAERKRAEQRMRESEMRFRATFETAAVGIAHVARGGRWLRANARLCEILGYSEVELRGLTLGALTHPDDLDPDIEHAARVLRGELETYSLEKRFVRQDGSPVWVYQTVSLVRDQPGEPDYFIAVIEDITTRREVQEHLETALAVKDEFLGLVSHQLRTPMTVILGMSRLLASGEDEPARIRELANDIARSADTLNDLIEGMLLLARLQYDEDPSREPLLLHRAADVVVQRQRARDPSREYALVVETSDTLVEGQGTWLQQAIANLVDNAAKHSTAGRPVRIVIESEGEEVTLRVLDEGEGIPKEQLDSLFEPFYRYSSSRQAPGTGLGLTIV